MTASAITIELTRAQVDELLRRRSQGGGVSSILHGLADGPLTSSYPALSASPRLSQSLLLGLLVLSCFPTDGEALAVTEVAGRLELSPSTTHRYMTTLLAVGLLEQDPRSRRYRIPLSA
ncbi:MAG: helix-turn-helix domain-containing protein [Solirubrobacteraceae bacterium]